MYKKMRNSFLFLVTGIILFFNCFATTNYYTAQTLERGKKVATPGFDYLLIKDSDQEIRGNPTVFFPSIGAAIGCPYRIETGFRWIWLYTFEANIRWQINPRTFKYFDASVNFHFGTFKVKHDPYFKMGITIGKDFSCFIPFVSYYRYNNADLNNDIFRSNVMAFGIGIPFRANNMLIPEICYYPSDGTMLFNIGLRVSVKKKNIDH